jgi:hypothetical protein
MISEDNENNLMFFRPGKEGFEDYTGEGNPERGIKYRYKHNIGGVSIHDAELSAQLQPGHKHDILYEAIMLLNGEIAAYSWDDKGQADMKLLSNRGDMVIFRPELNHTLLVKQDSHVFVVRYHPKDISQNLDERTSVPLPGCLDDIRKKMNNSHFSINEIQTQIETELKLK